MKKPVILLIVLAALAAFAAFYDKGRTKRFSSASLSGAALRELVIPELAADKIRTIRVREGDKQVTLVLKDGNWSVTERSGYAASLDKVRRAVTFLTELKIKGKQEVAEGVLGEVKLLAPGEGAADRTGLQVELLDEKGEALASIIAGQSTTTTGGASASSGQMFGGPGESRYVRVPKGGDKDTVWFVEDAFYELSTDPKEWLDKAFVNVQDVKSADISLPNAADSWKAERKDPGSPFAFVGAPAGDELDTAKADGLSNVLSSAYFNDVVPKDKVTADFMKGAAKAKVTTMDGFTYDLEILEKKEGAAANEAKYFITAKVSADIPKERKAAADEKPEDKKKNDEAFAARKKGLEEKLAKEKVAEGWTYEVSNYTVGALLKKRSEVLRDKVGEAPKPGDSGLPSVPGLPSIPGVTAPLPPPSSPGTPAAPVKPPVSVTTPPVSVEGAKPAPAPTPPPAPAKPAEAKP